MGARLRSGIGIRAPEGAAGRERKYGEEVEKGGERDGRGWRRCVTTSKIRLQRFGPMTGVRRDGYKAGR